MRAGEDTKTYPSVLPRQKKLAYTLTSSWSNERQLENKFPTWVQYIIYVSTTDMTEPQEWMWPLRSRCRPPTFHNPPHSKITTDFKSIRGFLVRDFRAIESTSLVFSREFLLAGRFYKSVKLIRTTYIIRTSYTKNEPRQEKKQWMRE
jgi:hypothetical protein